MADADKGFMVLFHAMDDGQWRAIPTRVRSRLALNGDIVPGQGLMWMGFDDGLLCREPRSRRMSRVMIEWWMRDSIPARHKLGGNLDILSCTWIGLFFPCLQIVGGCAGSCQAARSILTGESGSTVRVEEPAYFGMAPLRRIQDPLNEPDASG